MAYLSICHKKRGAQLLFKYEFEVKPRLFRRDSHWCRLKKTPVKRVFLPIRGANVKKKTPVLCTKILWPTYASANICSLRMHHSSTQNEIWWSFLGSFAITFKLFMHRKISVQKKHSALGCVCELEEGKNFWKSFFPPPDPPPFFKTF